VPERLEALRDATAGLAEVPASRTHAFIETAGHEMAQLPEKLAAGDGKQ